ncbi:pyridoxal phosphate-dependent aminotransferase, partial [Pseudomonas sp. MAFF 311095]
MDRVAARRAEGATIISLCAGEPDFDTPEHIREAGIDAIRNGHTRYTQVAGVRALREAVAGKFRRENGLDVTWQDTLVSNGGKHVIYNALAATLNEGDEVIVPAPYWVSYPEMVELCGGTAKILACGEQDGFKLTPAALEQAINPSTRWLILNSPSNPTGAVYSRQALQALAEVLLKHPHVLVLADDIYEHLVFDGQVFHTLAQVEPRLASRVLTMNGVSKAYAMTGWRIGFATGPRWLLEAMEKLQGQQTSGASAISQHAAIAALT